MPDLIYRYFPRFMIGLCAIQIHHRKPQYRLLTGPVTYSKDAQYRIAKVEFLNLFGFVLFPKVIVVYHRPSK